MKVDVASRHGRSFLGINVQYIMAGKIKVRTLSVQELRDNATSEYLLSIINSVLQTFGIDIEDVYSFTTDNGSNMIKLRKLIADAQKASIQTDDRDVSDHLDGDRL